MGVEDVSVCMGVCGECREQGCGGVWRCGGMRVHGVWGVWGSGVCVRGGRGGRVWRTQSLVSFRELSVCGEGGGWITKQFFYHSCMLEGY